MKRFVLWLFFSILVAGCSSFNFTLTGEKYEPLPEDAEVQVVLTGNVPDYEEIGVLQVIQTVNNLSRAVEKAKKEARKVGANLVILSGSDKTKSYSSHYSYATKSEKLTTTNNYEYLFIIGIRIDASMAPMPDIEIMEAPDTPKTK